MGYHSFYNVSAEKSTHLFAALTLFFVKRGTAMTLQEASERFHVSLAVLQQYEEAGLLGCPENASGQPDYQDAELERASKLCTLTGAGIDLDTLKRFAALLDQDKDTRAEQIRLLRKRRYQLLEEIHEKQQALDQLDYLIHKIKCQNR